ncbi:unnamed protein product [Closterium sp. NIES-64]|nr:unnamed protein product [Closterium sp. NIES-64]
MERATRSRRAVDSASASRKSALAELAAHRASRQSDFAPPPVASDDAGDQGDQAVRRKRRIDTFELKEEDRLYDVVDESEYQKIVAQRRAAGENFVVDDNGLGYADTGLEDVWDRRDDDDDSWDEDEDGGRRKKKEKKPAGPRPRRDGVAARKALSAAAAMMGKRRGASNMFAAAGARAGGRQASALPAGEAQAAEALLEELINDIGADAHERLPDKRRRRGGGVAVTVTPSAWRPLAQHAKPPVYPDDFHDAPVVTPSNEPVVSAGRQQPPPQAPPFADDSPFPDMTPAAAAREHQGLNAGAAGGGAGTGSESPSANAEPNSTARITGGGAGTKTGVKAESGEEKVPAAAAGEGVAAGNGAVEGGQSAKPDSAEAGQAPKLHARLGALAQEENASAAWTAVAGQTAVAGSAAVAGSDAPVSVEGLPLDADGKLPFFFLDAVEEPYGALQGTVFLFGKVPVKHASGTSNPSSSGSFVSCCVGVQGMQRCVFAVPREGLFEDSQLAVLEAEEQQAREEDAGKAGVGKGKGGGVKGRGGGKGEEESERVKAARLKKMRKLHELATPLKEEIRQRLMERHVSSFCMMPVKRSYAFERKDIPRGEQYVLKITYPYSDAPLPSDLTGTHFSALLGTHTSALELLLLKRRLKCPCWLAIDRPTRIHPGSQRSHCRVEVSVASPKLVAPAAAENDPPPLVVASLNVKTVVNHGKNVNEVAAVSVVFCRNAKIDRPMARSEWSGAASLGHFSVLRRLEGVMSPVGFDSAIAAANQRAGRDGPVLSKKGSERELLSYLLARMGRLDADVIIGHGLAAFDLTVLLQRMQVGSQVFFQACRVGNWSAIGRLKRTQMPKLGGGPGSNWGGGGAAPGLLSAVAGRLLIDTSVSSREILPKEVSHSLSALAASQLGQTRREVAAAEVPGMYGSSESLMKLVGLVETDAWLALTLMFQLSVLPLSRQLTNLSGNLWNRTLQGSRAQRIEYLLLHEFHRRKFMLPDKLTTKEKEAAISSAAATASGKKKKRKGAGGEKQEKAAGAGGAGEDITVTRGVEGGEEEEGDDENTLEGAEGGAGGARGKKGGRGGGGGEGKKGPGYAGGLVLEPKRGLYDKIVALLDFNSLYPSIIREYNICFTTVACPEDPASLPQLPDPDPPGVLPERRRQVKDLLKRENDPDERQRLEIRQQALKLTANSMYGCLGFSNSRFFAKPLAELITSRGRDILQSTVDLVQNNLNLEVIYGDTDSIMINTGLDDPSQAIAIAHRVKKEVRRRGQERWGGGMRGGEGGDAIYGDTDSIIINTGLDDPSQAIAIAHRVKKEAIAIAHRVKKEVRMEEIEMDGLFRSMLLLNKKYASVSLLNKKYASVRLLNKKYASVRLLNKKYASVRLLNKKYASVRLLNKKYASVRLLNKKYGSVRLLNKKYASVRLLNKKYASVRLLIKKYASVRLLNKKYASVRLLNKKYASVRLLNKKYASVRLLNKKYASVRLLNKKYASVRLLIKKYASVRLLNKKYASVRLLIKKYASVRLLIKKYASVRLLNKKYASVTLLNKKYASIRLLIKKYASVRLLNKKYASVRLLIKKYASVRLLNKKYASVRLLNKKYASVRLLNKKYASVRLLNKKYASVRLLNKKYASVRLLNKKYASVRLLIKKYASVRLLNKKYASVRLLNKKYASVRLLNKKYASVRLLNKKYASVRLLNKKYASVRLLIKKYASVRLLNKKYASVRLLIKKYASVRLLIKKYASVRLLIKKYASVRLLIKKYASVRLLNKKYASVRLLNKKYGSVRLLNKKYASVRLLNKKYASVRLLIKKYASVRLLNKKYASVRLLNKKYASVRLLNKKYASVRLLIKKYASVRLLIKKYASVRLLIKKYASVRLLILGWDPASPRVNKRYKLLEIEMDGLFRSMLLLNKKKYASVKLVLGSSEPPKVLREVSEHKGLDIVRRDWSVLSKEIGGFCLKQILSGRWQEHKVLREVAGAQGVARGGRSTRCCERWQEHKVLREVAGAQGVARGGRSTRCCERWQEHKVLREVGGAQGVARGGRSTRCCERWQEHKVLREVAGAQGVARGGRSTRCCERWQEHKGLDIVRRDWSVLSKEIGGFCLKEILSGRYVQPAPGSPACDHVGSFSGGPGGNAPIVHATQILSRRPREEVVESIHNELRNLAARLRAGEVDLTSFVITKTLTKPPGDYPDANSQPHVQVALRRKKEGRTEGCNAGDAIPYVIAVPRVGAVGWVGIRCRPVMWVQCGGSGLSEISSCWRVDVLRSIEIKWDDREHYLSHQQSGSEGADTAVPPAGRSSSGAGGIAERARHVDELRSAESEWDVDREYYLAHQVHPVVARLCAPIEGTDAARLADCLGLDSSKYRHVHATASMVRDDAMLAASSILDDDERYARLPPLQFLCPSCRFPFAFPGVPAIAQGRDREVLERAGERAGGAAGSRDSRGEGENGNAGEGKEEGGKEEGGKEEEREVQPLACPRCKDAKPLSPAMLSNQVKRQAEAFISQYYDAWMQCDEETCGCVTQNMATRLVHSDSCRGGLCPNYPRCQGTMRRQISEADLYHRLCYLRHSLAVTRTLAKVRDPVQLAAAERKLQPIRRALDAAHGVVERMCDSSAYKWVKMGDLCVT